MSENGNGSPSEDYLRGAAEGLDVLSRVGCGPIKKIQALPIKDLCAIAPVRQQGRGQPLFRGFAGRFAHGFGIPKRRNSGAYFQPCAAIHLSGRLEGGKKTGERN